MKRILVLVLVVTLGILGVVLGYFYLSTNPVSALEVLRTCSDEQSDDHFFSCVKAVLPQAIREDGAPAVMQMFEESYTLARCHESGHLVGRELYAQSPSLERALNQCSFNCASACTHGLVGAALASAPEVRDSFGDVPHLNVDTLRDIGAGLCAEREMCHAVGHILYQLFKELDQSLAWCDVLADGRESWSCYRGVFMENGFASSTHVLFEEARSPNVRDPNNLLYPCDSVAEKYQPGCYHNLHMNQATTLRERGVTDYNQWTAEVVGACARAGAMQAPCYEGVGSYLALNEYSVAEGSSLCNSLKGPANIKACIFGFGYALSAWGRTDDALGMCSTLPDTAVQYACYESVADDLSVRPSHELRAMCDGVSDVACMTALEYIKAGNPVRSVAR